MVSNDEETDTKVGEKMDWDSDMEIQLFYAMVNHKPVGVNKHFQMLSISEKLSNSIAKGVSIKDIWDHLETMYNLKLLDDTEPPTFPIEEAPFSLPEKEFGALMKQKMKEFDVSDDMADARSPSPKLRSSSRSNTKGRKDSTGGLLMATKNRKESGSSHASTETPRSEKSPADPRRDSRDSNTSGSKDPTTTRKSTQKDRRSRGVEEETPSRRTNRRQANTPTPSTITPPTTRRRT